MRAKPRRVIGDDGQWIGVQGVQSRYAGAYVLGDRDMILVWFVERPAWHKRLLMSWLLGWMWTDMAILDDQSGR